MLLVGVTGAHADRVRTVIDRLVDRGALPAGARPPRVDTPGILVREVVEGVKGSDLPLQFVIGVEPGGDLPTSSADVWLDERADSDEFVRLEELWTQRLVPFERNLRTGRRAPRRRTATVAAPDPDWPAAAARLIARLRAVVGDRVIRIDHIGSTAVPDLPAKDLIDLQVVAADLATATAVSRAATAAGFVPVPGSWFGEGRDGAPHPEAVSVDADPGRPVNINVRPVDGPVWRDALLLRDWLRHDPHARADYAALKRRLAARPGTDVDDYGTDKMPWIRAALRSADDWVTSSGWTP